MTDYLKHLIAMNTSSNLMMVLEFFFTIISVKDTCYNQIEFDCAQL